MIKIIHVNADELTVSLDTRSIDSAVAAAINCDRHQPDGYRLIAWKVVQRSQKGGRRRQLHLVLRHTNRAYPSIGGKELTELFSTEITLAGQDVSLAWTPLS